MNRCSGINFCGVYIKESCLFEVVSAVFSIHLGIFITVQYYAYKLHLKEFHMPSTRLTYCCAANSAECLVFTTGLRVPSRTKRIYSRPNGSTQVHRGYFLLL